MNAQAEALFPAAWQRSWKVVRSSVEDVWIAKRYCVSKLLGGESGLSIQTPGDVCSGAAYSRSELARTNV